MRVFITGGTGYVGQALVRAMVAGGHQVTALARSDEAEAKLRALGAAPHRGDVHEPASYADAARENEALIHAAVDYRRDQVPGDRAVIETFIDGASAGVERDGEPRIIVYTSGVWVLGNTGDDPANEDAPVDHPPPHVAWRPAHERRVLQAASDDGRVVTAVIRPGIVYGGHGGIPGEFFAAAQQGEPVVYVGDGTNRWPLVHQGDIADLYRRVVEQRAPGLFHGVEERSLPVREIARLIAEAGGSKAGTRSRPLDEAKQAMGTYAEALCLDQVVGAWYAQRRVGWRPAHESFEKSIDIAWREYRLKEQK